MFVLGNKERSLKLLCTSRALAVLFKVNRASVFPVLTLPEWASRTASNSMAPVRRRRLV